MNQLNTDKIDRLCDKINDTLNNNPTDYKYEVGQYVYCRNPMWQLKEYKVICRITKIKGIFKKVKVKYYGFQYGFQIYFRREDKIFISD